MPGVKDYLKRLLETGCGGSMLPAVRHWLYNKAGESFAVAIQCYLLANKMAGEFSEKLIMALVYASHTWYII